MRTFAALLVAASATALAQEIGFSGGSNAVTGSNAISNPNVNNGWQSDSSLFASGSGESGSLFNNVVGSSFSTVNSNSAVKDNIINNPTQSHVQGNEGWTANGDSNNLGPVQNLFGGAAGAVPFFKRGGDVVFADNHHQASAQLAATGVPVGQFVQPGFVSPGFIQPGVFRSAVLKRSGDVVFADNHHQLDAAAGFVGTAAPVTVGWSAPAALQFVVPAFQPVLQQPIVSQPLVAAQQPGQKATIVQNQA